MRNGVQSDPGKIMQRKYFLEQSLNRSDEHGFVERMGDWVGPVVKRLKNIDEGWHQSEVSIYQVTGKNKNKNRCLLHQNKNGIYQKNERFHAKIRKYQKIWSVHIKCRFSYFPINTGSNNIEPKFLVCNTCLEVSSNDPSRQFATASSSS